MEFSARGLVLAERTVGEWDKSLTLLCEGIGKISVWARGAKRVKSPLLAACSMFVLGSYSFVKKGERISVTSAQPEETFFGLRTDVEGLSLAVRGTAARGRAAVADAQCAVRPFRKTCLRRGRQAGL